MKILHIKDSTSHTIKKKTNPELCQEYDMRKLK